MVLVTGAAMLATAGVAFWTSRSEQRHLAEQRALLQQLERDHEAAVAREQQRRVRKGAERWQLLDGPDVVVTLQHLQAIGDRVGVAFEAQRAIKAADQGKQSFLVSGHGTPQQVTRFVAEIERHDRLMIIETGKVQPAGGPLVAFEFGLATYHRGGTR
ncbi:MAG: hypothetical protein KAI24_12350 [Planctomycetes bacterium]|nr:hypothetical protein [Planctomycetota bacterium]